MYTYLFLFVPYSFTIHLLFVIVNVLGNKERILLILSLPVEKVPTCFTFPHMGTFSTKRDKEIKR